MFSYSKNVRHLSLISWVIRYLVGKTIHVVTCVPAHLKCYRGKQADYFSCYVFLKVLDEFNVC